MPADLWSVGIVRYIRTSVIDSCAGVVLLVRQPFRGDDTPEVTANAVRLPVDGAPWTMLDPDETLPDGPDAKAALRVIKGLLVRHPRERVTCHEVASYEWFGRDPHSQSVEVSWTTPGSYPSRPVSVSHIRSRESEIDGCKFTGLFLA
jgi:hypothetical protein